MKRLAERQHALLSLIAQHTRTADGAAGPLHSFWVPQPRSQYVDAINLYVWVSGAGDASRLRTMARRGWIKAESLPYSFSITEDGLLAIEQHRESTGFYKTIPQSFGNGRR